MLKSYLYYYPSKYHPNSLKMHQHDILKMTFASIVIIFYLLIKRLVQSQLVCNHSNIDQHPQSKLLRQSNPPEATFALHINEISLHIGKNLQLFKPENMQFDLSSAHITSGNIHCYQMLDMPLPISIHPRFTRLFAISSNSPVLN